MLLLTQTQTILILLLLLVQIFLNTLQEFSDARPLSPISVESTTGIPNTISGVSTSETNTSSEEYQILLVAIVNLHWKIHQRLLVVSLHLKLQLEYQRLIMSQIVIIHMSISSVNNCSSSSSSSSSSPLSQLLHHRLLQLRPKARFAYKCRLYTNARGERSKEKTRS